MSRDKRSVPQTTCKQNSIKWHTKVCKKFIIIRKHENCECISVMQWFLLLTSPMPNANARCPLPVARPSAEVCSGRCWCVCVCVCVSDSWTHRVARTVKRRQTKQHSAGRTADGERTADCYLQQTTATPPTADYNSAIRRFSGVVPRRRADECGRYHCWYALF